PRQRERLGIVADDAGDAGIDLTRLDLVDDGLQVGAVARNEHPEFDRLPVGHYPSTSSTHSHPSGQAPISPMIHAFSPRPLSRSTTSSASPAATASTMPIPMLKVRYISSRSTLPASARRPKSAGRSHLEMPMVARHPGGSTRGTFSSRPPPVMWAMPLMLKSLSRFSTERD